MSDTRKPLDNALDAIRDCSSVIEEKIGDIEHSGVFSIVFDRDKAKQIMQDYMSLVLVGRAG